MINQCNFYETDEYKFVNFSGILDDIRNCFMEDIEEEWDVTYPIDVSRSEYKKYTRHSTLVGILKACEYLDAIKTNVILIPTDVVFTSCDLFQCDVQFMANAIRIIDKCKRKLPILIKRVDCKFNELCEYLKTGEGEEFIMQVSCDKEKLRKQVCSFMEFKKFAKKEGFIYILDNLIDKIEFKRLFMS